MFDANGVGNACDVAFAALNCRFLAPYHGRTDGNHPINVKGDGFQNVVEVEVDGVSVPFRLSGTKNIHVRSPAHPAGIVDVTLRTADGQECTLPYEYR